MDGRVPERTSRWRIEDSSWSSNGAVLLLMFAGALLLYRQALNFGFNSDAFVLFRQASASFPGALRWDESYHYMPLTSLWIWLQHLIFGSRQGFYELLNILQHGIISWLVFRLARELKIDFFLALLAGLLYLFAGSAYQVALWSIVGSNYFVSGLLYLTALMVFIRRTRDGAGAGVAVSLLFALALLSHEQSLSFLPVCFVFSLLVIEASGGAGVMQLLDPGAWSRSFHRILPLLAPFAAFGLMKALMSAHGRVSGFGQNPVFFFSSLIQALARSISLRGNQEALSWIRMPENSWLLIAAVLVMALLLIFVFFLLSPVEKFLLTWCFGHVVLMQMAIGVSVRHTYLPSVAGVILDVLIIRRIALLIVSRFKVPQDRAPATTAFLSFSVAAILLLIPGYCDIQTAVSLWNIADAQTRSLEKCVEAVGSDEEPPARLYLLNPRSRLLDRRFEVFVFQNGASALVKMLLPSLQRGVTILYTVAENNVASSRWTNQQVLQRLVEQKNSIVLYYDPETSSFSRLRSEIVARDFSESRMIEAPCILRHEESPSLGWREGAFPYLEIAPGTSLELDIPHSWACGRWLFVRYYGEAERAAEIAVEGMEAGRLRFPEHEKAQWTQQTIRIPAPLPEGEVHVLLRAAGGKPFQLAGAGFLPVREDFSAPSTPEMPWSVANVLKLAPKMSFRIPVPDCETGPCAVSLVHRVEFEGSLSLRDSSGPIGGFGEPMEERSPRWISEICRGGRWESAWVEVMPEGGRGSRILQVHFDSEGAKIVAGGGVTDLYWAGPGGAEISRSGSYINPWILGFLTLGLLVLALGSLLLFLKFS